ncbi:hypothetical protein DL96DRAFT_165089 [Flagelloscypha sp. PMI_526]|nr:hypothetical protein DL96DRAFT_165089 [Flagelloscypha sp. PMI_526]
MALTFSQLGAADFGLAIAFGTLVLFVGSFVVYKTTTRLSGAQATSTIVSVWLAWIFSIAYFLLLALSQGYIALSRTQRSQHINAAGIQTSPATESQASSTIGSQAGLAAAAFESLTISAWIFALTSLTYVLLNRAETTIPKHMPIVRIALPFVVGCSTLAPILAVIYTSKYDIISSQALFGLEITDAILRFLATLLLMVVTARSPSSSDEHHFKFCCFLDWCWNGECHCHRNRATLRRRRQKVHHPLAPYSCYRHRHTGNTYLASESFFCHKFDQREMGSDYQCLALTIVLPHLHPFVVLGP